MEIILGQLALSHGLITEKLFVAIVVMAIATSLLAGPAMQKVLQRKQKRKLADYLGDPGFLGHFKSSNREGAIRELCGLASEATGLEAGTAFDAAWYREQLVSTGLPNGLAVPHARLKGIDKPVVFVGLSNAGIDFDAPDGTNAEIVCLLLSPEDDPETQLEMLQAVAEAFQSPNTHREALAANNITEFRAALMTADPPEHGH
jgi:mannitol/fructose-specific phosphotransferase system IIA component (Ntr-type)